MGFRGVDFAHLARFNSATSSEILEFYETFVDNKILAELAEPDYELKGTDAPLVNVFDINSLIQSKSK